MIGVLALLTQIGLLVFLVAVLYELRAARLESRQRGELRELLEFELEQETRRARKAAETMVSRVADGGVR